MSHESFDQIDEADGRRPSVKLVLFLLLAAALVVFFLQNGGVTRVEFLWMEATWSVRAVILVSVVIGILLDRLGLWQWRRARRRKAEASNS